MDYDVGSLSPDPSEKKYATISSGDRLSSTYSVR